MHLGRLEERINTEPRFRDEFLKDPVAILRREGLILSFEQERRLREAVAKLATAKPPVGGATIKEKIGIIMIGG
jgi:hypothetical protein